MMECVFKTLYLLNALRRQQNRYLYHTGQSLAQRNFDLK
jgi:hypothetical protein